MTISHRISVLVLSLLAALGVTFGAAWVGYQTARADESAIVGAQPDAGLAASAAPAPAQGDIAILPPDDLARDIYRGVANKDWFLVAGGALSLLVLAIRWLLVQKWPRFESEIWGVALVAALAGFGALGNAWLADERLASTTTLLGAVKVWAAAVFAYVTSKKLLSAATTGA